MAVEQAGDVRGVMERLDRLQRGNRRLRLTGLAVTLAVVVVVLMGQDRVERRRAEAERIS